MKEAQTFGVIQSKLSRAQLLDFLVNSFSVIVFDDAIISQPYKIIKVVLIAYFSVNP